MKKKLSRAEVLRRREWSRRYRESHKGVIKAYNKKRKKQMAGFRQSVFDEYLKNPRKLLNRVKARKL
jgi:hypothetical protein